MAVNFKKALKLARSIIDSDDIDVLIEAAGKIIEFEAQLNGLAVTVAEKPLTLAEFLNTTKRLDPYDGDVSFTPYLWQRHAAEYIEANPVTLLASGRQIGMTSLLVRAIYHAALSRKSNILVIGSKYYMLQHQMRMLDELAKGASVELMPQTCSSKNRTTFANGSTIIWHASSKNDYSTPLRGKPDLDLVVVDNSEFISFSDVDRIISDVIPRIDEKAGRLVVSGLGYQDGRSLLGRLWDSDIHATRHIVPSTNVLRTERPTLWDAVYESKKVMSDAQWRKEYMCEFVADPKTEPKLEPKPSRSERPANYRDEWDKSLLDARSWSKPKGS